MADVLGFFKKALPFITTGLSLAGPPGMAASVILGKVLNVNNPTPDSVTKALSSLTLTPEVQAQLQEAEQQYRLQMQSMGYQHEEDLAKLAVEDRSNARQMQISVKSWVPPTLAILVTLGFFGLLGLMLFRGFPPSSAQVLDIMTGSLGTAWITIIGFYFGSSSGSEQKSQTLAEIAKA